MASYIEDHAGAISVLGLAIAVGELVIRHFFPILPDSFYLAMAPIAVVLSLVGIAGLFVRKRKASGAQPGDLRDDALFDIEGTDFTATDTETRGSRKLLRAKDSTVKLKRWWHRP